MSRKDRLRILVVDDEQIVRYTLEMFLEHLGHEACCCDNGEEGLRALEREDFDAAFVDIRMPGLDGVAFLGRCRRMCPGTPVIMVSGHGSDETLEEVRRAGAHAFLAKPFRMDEIEALLDRLPRRLPEDGESVQGDGAAGG